MNIRYDSYDKNNLLYSQAKTAAEVPSQYGEKGIKDINVAIQDLPKGAVFEGEVIKVQDGQVTLRLNTGDLLSARLDFGVELLEGQSTVFQILENTGKQISIRLLDGSYTENKLVSDALKAAGLQSSEKNIEIVKNLLKEQMPIDRQSIKQVIRHSVQEPEADVRTLIRLDKLGLPVTKEMAGQLEAYLAGEHKLAGQLNEALTQVPKAFAQQIGQVTDTAGIKEQLQIQKEFVDLLISENTEHAKSTQNIGEMQNIQFENCGQSEKATAMPDTYTQATVLENTVQQTEAVPVDIERAVVQQNVVVQEVALQEGITQTDTMQTDTLQTGAEQNIMQTDTTKTGMSGEPHAAQVTLEQILTPKERQELAQILEESGAETDVKEQIQQGDVTPERFLQMVKEQDFFSKELITSKSYEKILKEKIKETWFLQPESVDKESVQETIQRIRMQTKQMLHLLQQAGVTADNPAAKQLSTAGENLDFMQQFHQQCVYMQLPIRVNGQEINSELYVYTNRKNLQNKEGKISALLHFDMEALGSMNIYAELEQKNVFVRFEMEDVTSLILIQEHIEELETQLNRRGFTSVCVAQTGQGEDEPLQELFQNIITPKENEEDKTRYTIDVKA